MEHWFDDLAKGMARGTLSRRGALKGTLQAGLAAAAGVFGRADGLAAMGSGEPGTPVPQQVRVEKRGPCTITFNGEQSILRHSIQSAVNGRPLTHNFEITLTRPARRGQSPQINSVRRIRIGDNLLLRVERESREGSTEVKVFYGPAFQGIRQATFTTDGKVIDGLIDGRRTSPLAIGADPSSMKFADGNPPPQVILRPAVEQALTAILKQAKDEISSCSQAGPAASNASDGWPLLASNQVPPSPWASRFAGKGKASSLLALTLGRLRSSSASLWGSPELADAAGEPWAMPGIVPGPDPTPPQGNPVNSQGCQSCQNGCAAAGAACDFGVSGGCVASLIFYGACVVAGLATCAATGAVCINNCNNPGGGCCPVGCPNGGCCDTAWQCTPTESVCCAPNVVVCGDNCCPPGFICKDGVCCTTDRQVCNGICCPQGQLCSTEGICCPQLEFNQKPVSCKGTCCSKGTVCCQGVCCSSAACKKNICCEGTSRWCGNHCCSGPCCGNKCCQLCLGGQMINGECCPQERVCGKVCCAPSLSCIDGTCKTAKCPQGEYKCSSEMSDGTFTTICCPDKNQSCCNKVCCAPGYICLTIGGVFGCNPAPPIK